MQSSPMPHREGIINDPHNSEDLFITVIITIVKIFEGEKEAKALDNKIKHLINFCGNICRGNVALE